MSSSEESKLLKKIYETLLTNDEWRKKIIKVLNPDYVKRDELNQVLIELKKQREDFNKNFEAMVTKSDFQKALEAMDKRFEAMVTKSDFQKALEAMDKRFEAMVTKSDFQKALEAMDKRFEAMDKRFEAMDKRFEAMVTKSDFQKALEAIDKRFEKFEDKMDTQFNKVFSRLDELSESFGHDFEEFNSYWLETFLEGQGYPKIDIKKKTFFDQQYEVFPNSKDVEIDLFNEEPLVIGEVTAIVKRIDKITTFLRKVAFIEKRFGKADHKLFITYVIESTIREEALELLEEAGIDIIILRDRKKKY